MCALFVLPPVKIKKISFFLLVIVEVGKYVEHCLIVFQLFITVMDKLRLEIRAMDEVNKKSVKLK